MQFVEKNLQFEDLFAVKEEDALNAQNVSPPECPLTVGEQYKVLWERYGKSLRAWAKETRLIRADERTMQLARFGEYTRAFEEMDAGSVEYSLRKLAAEIRSILIQTAEKDFAPEGINLTIDRVDVDAKFLGVHLHGFDHVYQHKTSGLRCCLKPAPRGTGPVRGGARLRLCRLSSL